LERDYQDADPFLLIGILKGAFIFLSDLTRQLSVPHAVDFMAISSYGKGAQSSGAVRILMDLREPIVNKHVLIVEDIVDTGSTLGYLLATLRGRNPASLRTCVLLRKDRKGMDIPVDYLGFTIPDVWVVGYGLDFGETFRTLPFIAELKKDVYS
jgi:hypoxanthine phosphoribosyltransferase